MDTMGKRLRGEIRLPDQGGWFKDQRGSFRDRRPGEFVEVPGTVPVPSQSQVARIRQQFQGDSRPTPAQAHLDIITDAARRATETLAYQREVLGTAGGVTIIRSPPRQGATAPPREGATAP